MPTDPLGRELLALARQAIDRRFHDAAAPTVDDPALKRPGAVFVTLTQDGELRGCIGSLEAWRPLADDVCDNARAAAFRDPRFSPLTASEWPRTRVEVSLLTPAEPMSFRDEADALRQLRPGIDGVILEYDGHRATFLPQVWEQLPEPQRFIAQLKRKAGLAADFWSDAVRLSRYRVEKWKE
ncbi:MAG TPA: AmmeMemoRadiSam system protein A [Azospira sp.]|nr:AmmeMemoRadiSam system protein A [Azospira sp.]